MSPDSPWPPLPFGEWRKTCQTLHLWTQIVGKVRLALTPLVNHWWNVTYHLTSRGFTTRPIPYRARTFSIDFDFIDHCLSIATSDGVVERLDLAPMSVAVFYGELMRRLQALGIEVHIWTMPSEIEDAVPFDQDHANVDYDPLWARRFWVVLSQSHRVMNEFRARFIGKTSPVHFFWGSFDLAVTRFSGRAAPPPSGTTPHLASWVMQEAYSHEVYSCGSGPATVVTARRPFMSMPIPSPPASARRR